MDSWVECRDEYEDFAEDYFPAKILPNDAGWIKVVAWIKCIVTFGVCKPQDFLDRFAFTLGPNQYFPGSMNYLAERTIVHECRHSWQYSLFGWAVPIAGWFFGKRVRAWCGVPFFLFFYFILFLPLGLAYFRWILEADADYSECSWMIQNKYTKEEVMDEARGFGHLVCGSDYGWAWPSWLGGTRKFIKNAEKIIELYGD